MNPRRVSDNNDADIVNGKALAEAVKAVRWDLYLSHGTVKIQIREGKPTLVTIERTYKLD